MGLLARDIMQEQVQTAEPEMPLAALADLLVTKRIGGVPVVEEGEVVGVVSRSDFARAVSLEHSLAGLVAEADEPEEFAPAEKPGPVVPPRAVEKQTVRDVMVPVPVAVTPTTPIEEVAEVLVKRHLHRVLVLDGKALRGVISSLDIVRLVAGGKLRAA